MLKLNVYGKENGKFEVVKTYTANDFDLMFGTIEDIVKIIDVEKLQRGNVSDIEFAGAVAQLVVGSMDLIKPILMDTFEGLTEDELHDGVKLNEIIPVVINMFKYAMGEMQKITSKNV